MAKKPGDVSVAGGTVKGEPISDQAQRQTRHRATYATDKRQGGYLIRVQGPQSNAFVGRTVPVILKAGGIQHEELERLIWTGKDEETGQPVSLYKFKAKPKEPTEEIEF